MGALRRAQAINEKGEFLSSQDSSHRRTTAMSLNLMHLIAENSAAMNTTEQRKAGGGGKFGGGDTAARYGGTHSDAGKTTVAHRFSKR